MAPRWLMELPNGPPADEINACANGLLYLPSLELLPHTPAFFTHNALDFAYDPHAPRPQQWLDFLHQLWPDDEASIATLQEIFGLMLTGETRHQKSFLIVGPKRSGSHAELLSEVAQLRKDVARLQPAPGQNENVVRAALQPLLRRMTELERLARGDAGLAVAPRHTRPRPLGTD